MPTNDEVQPLEFAMCSLCVLSVKKRGRFGAVFRNEGFAGSKKRDEEAVITRERGCCSARWKLSLSGGRRPW